MAKFVWPLLLKHDSGQVNEYKGDKMNSILVDYMITTVSNAGL
ncbi:MAG: hypothetical protein Q8941_04375 [Bacteroidota bacterium]|nr:hypothetical protein [Bacteroidota bacterium]